MDEGHALYSGQACRCSSLRLSVVMLTKCDNKSGYDHVLLTMDARSYFGFSFGGLWFVCTTLPFGWKISPYIYHTVGLAVSGFVRAQGVPCSLYIDDRLNGELLTSQGPWLLLPAKRPTKFWMGAAKAAIYVVLSVLVSLGYTIGIKNLSCGQLLLWSFLALLSTLRNSPFWYLAPRLTPLRYSGSISSPLNRKCP